ncbi:ACT domain-containing protein [Lysobacter sp. TY2-98]|uniref:ACT domain-containing protein n=1 Tax=Lysobacter sp. TY2-98 TaxID=2290922 RepID=UPI000E1FBA9C|nr:ACT domain-containing protein [Lysobacter sp. TY2-98]AXK73162.1 ACT domain-containing protein [Lysobacter sp. TY2-98]
MTGEIQLPKILANLDVRARPGTFVLISRTSRDAEADAVAVARIDEDEGVTYVVPEAFARSRGEPPGFVAAWLTLAVHSALNAVGLTAAVAGVLAEQGIACNVIAGHYHDHLLVPAARRDDAIAAIRSLRAR